MQMISKKKKKKKKFSVCLHFRKMIRKILYIVCLEQRLKKKKKTTKTIGIHQKWELPLPATQTHPKTHLCQPPQPTPQPTTGHHKSTKRKSRQLGLKLSVLGSSCQPRWVRIQGGVDRRERGSWIKPTEKESREKEQRASRLFWKMVYRKKKFINRFPFYFCEGFSSQK